MKLTIESTDVVTRADGVLCRVWKGTSDTGVPVVAFVRAVAADTSHDLAQFDAELQEMPAPRELPLHLVFGRVTN